LSAAQQWPSSSVRILLPNSSGTVTDVASRIFADHVSRLTGGSLVVENKPGADGYIAAQEAVRSAPDGNTLFFSSQSFFSINPHVKKVFPFDLSKDFTPIAVMMDVTGATGFYTHPASPYNDLKEMIAYAKQNPGKLSFASIVPLFSMIGAYVNKRAGIDMVDIKYKTQAQAVQDTIAGRMPIYLDATASMEPHLKAGKLKLLAINEPSADYPQVMKFQELWPDYQTPGLVVLTGPGGMNSALTLRINRVAAQVIENPKFNQDLEKIRWKNTGGANTPQGTAELMARNREAWGRFVMTAGVEPE
jgi:tripartite-type tricarboxylate transporter receptor subunit TctC